MSKNLIVDNALSSTAQYVKDQDANASPLSLTNGNNVGIGTTGPAQKLEIADGNIIVDRIADAAYSRYIGIGGSDGSLNIGTSGGSQVEFESIADDNSSNKIHFLTHNGGVSHARRVTIDKTGKVGIGIANPDTPLHIYMVAQSALLAEP